MRMIRLSGETVTLRDVRIYQDYYSDSCILSIGYGTSETSGIMQSFITKDKASNNEKVSFDTIIEGIDVVLHDDLGQPISTNQIGEIIAVSDYISPGYWGRPDLTDQVFSRTPEGKRLYRTGDLGMVHSDGSLEHLGRKDFQVQIRGHRVELEEIENTLLDLPSIIETTVKVHQEDCGDVSLIAYVVLEKGVKTNSGEIRACLLGVLPSYMIPTKIILIDELPLTRDGKVNKLNLPNPESVIQSRDNQDNLPLNPIEEKLVKIWADVFERKEIGIQDDFFELGGQSIEAAKIISRIDDAFRIKINLREFFALSTVAAMSQLIGKNGHDKEK